MKIHTLFMMLMAALLFASCSSTKEKEVIHTKKNMATDFAVLGNESYDEGYYLKAREYFEASLDYASSVDYRQGAVRAWNSLSKTHLALGDYKDAEYAARKALLIAEEDSFYEDQSLAYHNLGELALIQGDLALADERLAKALSLVTDDRREAEDTALLYHVTGVIRKKQGRLEEALQSLETARSINEENKNIAGMASNDYMVGVIYLQQNRIAEAETKLLEALAMDKKIERSLAIATDLKALAVIEIKKGDLELADELYLRAYMVYKGQGLKNKMISVLDKLADLAEQRNRSDMAEYYRQTRNSLNAL